jgi:hypothetical protein
MNKELKEITMSYRSAKHNGYVKTDGIQFRSRATYNRRFAGRIAWEKEMVNIVKYVKQNRARGIDTVAVVHGMNHPNPDMVATYIYTRPTRPSAK